MNEIIIKQADTNDLMPLFDLSAKFTEFNAGKLRDWLPWHKFCCIILLHVKKEHCHRPRYGQHTGLGCGRGLGG